MTDELGLCVTLGEPETEPVSDTDELPEYIDDRVNDGEPLGLIDAVTVTDWQAEPE